MRIIGGAARSIPLAVPPDMAVRPTADRSREALFNSLGDLAGAVVWDLYAGSGALGLEAMSRGAVFVGFVEREARHCDFISRNAAKVGTAVPAAATNVVNSPVELFRFQPPAPTLVLADPPYDDSLTGFRGLIGRADFRSWAKNAVIVWELPDRPAGVTGEFLLSAPRSRRVRRFGGTDFLIINSLEGL
ncbi:MAG: RsmD family RNA methyltransferase [Victivallaceae bacterium]|nr:RsmD family RNA methyltransferase [Victivallaceae bacterium]